METVQLILSEIQKWLAFPLFTLGEADITLWTLVYVAVLTIGLFYVSNRLRGWLVTRLLTRSQMDIGAREATGTIVHYLLISLGLMIILQLAGIQLTTLNVLAGALGLGLGFGLQNIVNNFISGLIILFERPIKVNDRVELGEILGQVVRINARSTTIVTNDNIAVIVPNLKFITENVVNWSHTDEKVRFKIPASVAYGSDVQLVERLLLEVAAESPEILTDPAPVVRFMEFGDNALHFELRVWNESLIHQQGKLVSGLNFAIYQKFNAHNISIPFPQRDLHLRSSEVELRPPA